jgi:rSAM/selenodomain-associated transferase 1
MTTAPIILGLFAKRPVPGRAKTRLAAETSPEWAADVARAFLLDTIFRLGTLPVRRVLAYAPASAHEYFRQAVGGLFELTPQADGDLGRRLAAFAAGQFRAGAGAVVLVGSDSPSLPVEHVTRAFTELARADVVLGPATDGGYYLLGLTPRAPDLFAGIPWGGPDVLRATVERLAGTDSRLALLPPWYDVDTLADWRALRGHLAALARAGHPVDLPHTLALPEPPEDAPVRSDPL